MFSRKFDEVGLFLDRIGRIGTAEAAWIGITDDEVDVIREVIVRVWMDSPQEGMRERIKAIAENHPV